MNSEPAVVVQKAYDWTLWIVPKVEKFPKSHRFQLGQMLVTASLELLMHLVDATYQIRNAGSLAEAVREVNRIRYLMRLAKDLKVINLEAHEFAAKALDEMGRIRGGWLKSVREKAEGRQLPSPPPSSQRPGLRVHSQNPPPPACAISDWMYDLSAHSHNFQGTPEPLSGLTVTLRRR